MLTCPSCGEENPERAKFCLSCGAPLAAEQAPGRMERKFATALFADLVGSTTLAEQEDPEVVQSVVGRTFDRLSAEITRYGGHLEKFMGDAVLAVFGIPRAHEDDPERAVRAAHGDAGGPVRAEPDVRRGGEAAARDEDRPGGGRGAGGSAARDRPARSHAHRRRGEHRRSVADRRRPGQRRRGPGRVRLRQGGDRALRAPTAHAEGQGGARAGVEGGRGDREASRRAPGAGHGGPADRSRRGAHGPQADAAARGIRGASRRWSRSSDPRGSASPGSCRSWPPTPRVCRPSTTGAPGDVSRTATRRTRPSPTRSRRSARCSRTTRSTWCTPRPTRSSRSCSAISSSRRRSGRS